MDSDQLATLLSRHRCTRLLFRGVLPIDCLPMAEEEPERGFYIVNTDPSGQPGAHWVLVWWEPGRRYFFDSFGYHPGFWDERLGDFMGPNCAWNNRALQAELEDTCGEWCVYLADCLCRGVRVRMMSDFELRCWVWGHCDFRRERRHMMMTQPCDNQCCVQKSVLLHRLYNCI